jgi:hypothetical protein
MPQVKLSVRMTFSDGEELLAAAETRPTNAEQPEPFAPQPPYVLGSATAPEQPVLVSSSSFIRIG